MYSVAILSVTVAKQIQVVRSIRNANRDHQSSYPVFFSCARNAAEPERSDPAMIVRCLLRQIPDLPGATYSFQQLKERYLEQGTSGDLTIEEATDLIIRIITERRASYILIDALDECQMESRHLLVKALERIISDSASLVKLFVTSRDDQDIVFAMEKYPSIPIKAENNQADIDNYVSVEVDSLIDQRRLMPTVAVRDSLRQLIKQRLYDGAQGMYVYFLRSNPHLAIIFARVMQM